MRYKSATKRMYTNAVTVLCSSSSFFARKITIANYLIAADIWKTFGKKIANTFFLFFGQISQINSNVILVVFSSQNIHLLFSTNGTNSSFSVCWNFYFKNIRLLPFYICFTTRFDNQKDTEIAFEMEMCISSRINDLFGAALLPAVYLCIPADFFFGSSVCADLNVETFLIRNYGTGNDGVCVCVCMFRSCMSVVAISFYSIH